MGERSGTLGIAREQSSVIESEPPQPNLYKYNGAIRWKQMVPGYPDDDPEDMTEPITIDNVLLRGNATSETPSGC